MFEQLPILPPPKMPSVLCPFKVKQTSILSLELPHGQPVAVLPSSNSVTEIPLGAVNVTLKSPTQVCSMFRQTCSKKLFTPKLLLFVVSTTRLATTRKSGPRAPAVEACRSSRASWDERETCSCNPTEIGCSRRWRRKRRES